MVARVDPRRAVSDEELIQISRQNPGWQVELVGGFIEMVPTGLEGGFQSLDIGAFLREWANSHGYRAADSSTGFRLPNNDVLSPDVALLPRERLARLTMDERKKFGTIVPDVVVELVSESDSLAALRRKCERWRREGAGYVVLLDPPEGVETWGTAPQDFPTAATILETITREA